MGTRFQTANLTKNSYHDIIIEKSKAETVTHRAGAATASRVRGTSTITVRV